MYAIYCTISTVNSVFSYRPFSAIIGIENYSYRFFFKFLFNFFRGGRGTLLDTGHGKPTSLCRRALLCVGFVAFVLPDTQLSNSSGSFNNNLVDQKVTIPIPLYRMLLLSSIDFLCKVNFNFTEVYLSI